MPSRSEAVSGLARALLLFGLLACGCRSQPPSRGPSRVGDTRKEPLTVEEVETTVRNAANDLGLCYRTERRQLVVGDLSSYVLQLRVPADGKPPEVSVVTASIPGQASLQDCVVRVLARLRFPPHPGERITLNVPIEAPE